MVQPPFLRLSPLGFALGCAAAAFVAIVLRAVTFGLGYGMWGHAGRPYMHGPFGAPGMGMPMYGALAGFAILAAIGGIVIAGILGAVVALTYNATVVPRTRPPGPSGH